MYAVFEDGSRQYRVQEGDIVRLDYREAKVGDNVEFAQVLLCQAETGAKIGQPLVAGAKIMGQIVDFPTTKIQVQHFRRRKNYRRLRGHTQFYTAVKIQKIVSG